VACKPCITVPDCSRPLCIHSSAPAIPEPTVTGPSASDIAKVVEEHKAREERKQAKEKSKDDQSNEKGKDTLAKKDGEKGNASPANVVKQSDSPSTPAKGHRRYELHRALFTMRQRELRTREQAVHAKERSKGAFLHFGGFYSAHSQVRSQGSRKFPEERYEYDVHRTCDVSYNHKESW
jgi:hypothetical protein